MPNIMRIRENKRLGFTEKSMESHLGNLREENDAQYVYKGANWFLTIITKQINIVVQFVVLVTLRLPWLRSILVG